MGPFIQKRNNMEKEFIPYEQALALKELGFDEPCMSSRDMNNGEGLIQLPLYQQAFRWFRDKHVLHSYIETSQSITNGYLAYDYVILGEGIKTEDDGRTLNTYEEAELECLKKLISIVKS